jgi:hypothetical protein
MRFAVLSLSIFGLICIGQAKADGQESSFQVCRVYDGAGHFGGQAFVGKDGKLYANTAAEQARGKFRPLGTQSGLALSATQNGFSLSDLKSTGVMSWTITLQEGSYFVDTYRIHFYGSLCRQFVHTEKLPKDTIFKDDASGALDEQFFDEVFAMLFSAGTVSIPDGITDFKKLQ